MIIRDSTVFELYDICHGRESVSRHIGVSTVVKHVELEWGGVSADGMCELPALRQLHEFRSD